MSDLKVVRKHTIGLKKAKVAAQKVADDLAQEYGMESTWEGNVLRFTRKGVDGALTVTKDEVVLDAKLGFLLSTFKHRIEEHVNDNFDRYFA
ncbi:MAG TPA: polyhydroxyalkanoic acid system family protein [Quisquiliibacterium sp.]|nr:polyhydroxyalkanoic acid system family protein [Quisquiliibacterium sp.]HPA91690.1 polyhydroxyalkanoic acid system family protein [Quisquiliibacterium sp.]